MGRPVFIGIAGGSGSGKSSVAQEIVRRLPKESVAVLEQDAYYKDQGNLPFGVRLAQNYDHPFAFDWDLLSEQLDALARGEAIERPVYDFRAYTRSAQTVRVQPCDVVILEGLFVLEDATLRQRLDIKLYVDTDADVRILRRLVRDINERSRTLDSVVAQYLQRVRPAHLEFVEPSKRYADVIIPEGAENRVAIDLIVTKVRSVLQSRGVTGR
ncbi:MAG: uridine kinase [Firmicutes bacterium]|nr:uridine kinase [Bacillota bacterium]